MEALFILGSLAFVFMTVPLSLGIFSENRHRNKTNQEPVEESVFIKIAFILFFVSLSLMGIGGSLGGADRFVSFFRVN